MQHIQSHHETEVASHTKSFDNMAKFEEWKQEEEVSSNQWRSQTFPDGGAQSFYRILSMITHRHAGSYVHLLKVVVCMEKA